MTHVWPVELPPVWIFAEFGRVPPAGPGLLRGQLRPADKSEALTIAPPQPQRCSRAEPARLKPRPWDSARV